MTGRCLYTLHVEFSKGPCCFWCNSAMRIRIEQNCAITDGMGLTRTIERWSILYISKIFHKQGMVKGKDFRKNGMKKKKTGLR